jgi:prepilin-type N-terminal cleavage/methylation domain-containing protein
VRRSRSISAGGRGFTLIEVLIAIVLILALTGGMMSYIWGLLGSRERLVSATDQQIAAAALFEELEQDLSATFAADGAGAAGVEGTSSSLTVRSRGVATLAGGGVSDMGDLQGCEVKFAAQELTARRLMKDQTSFEILASPVGRVQMRYFDGSAWKSQFNSATSGALPVAVEVAIWFDADGGSGSASSSNASATPKSADEGTTPDEDEKPTRAPDRVRVMVVPDGPVSSWKSKL